MNKKIRFRKRMVEEEIPAYMQKVLMSAYADMSKKIKETERRR